MRDGGPGCRLRSIRATIFPPPNPRFQLAQKPHILAARKTGPPHGHRHGEGLPHQGGVHGFLDLPARLAGRRQHRSVDRRQHRLGAAARAGRAAHRLAGARPVGPPGFSPMDQTKSATSKQDQNLKPHPTPPIATPVDKLPLDKIKLPAGFKAEVWSSGHPGGRTMVMGDKGTMFMGTRIIGRVYAITDKDGKRERQGAAAGPDPAERPRLQGRLALRVRDQQGLSLRQYRGQPRQPAGSRSS